ncbi:hypothetical protein SAMN05444168_6025 [Paraburkholderia phenazinium]|uniref:Uncharacterized protein n=1 Tax=Paraburkholderia phenazinium TaxID=60549 RepID=A0A1N6K4S0_9BURK|nr:hypothetical protein SAMN05444168_6025 [Paraburkholderia phenazinium]
MRAVDWRSVPVLALVVVATATGYCSRNAI